MKYVLALDQGTTSSRAILFDRQARIVSVVQQEFAQHYPHPGWVEHDAKEIWSTQIRCAQRCLQSGGVGPWDICGIGITNQRETTVVWDRATGEPIAPAIVWQDRRTAAICAGLKEQGLEDEVRMRTGLCLDPYFSATKISWILDSVPGARQRAEKGELAFGTIDCWLTWNLTGVHATDVTNASRTALFNIGEGRWDDRLLEIFRVPRQMLPQVVSSSGIVGRCKPELLGASIPVCGIAGDQQAATFGQGCFASGMAKNTYGTGGFLLMNAGEALPQSKNKLLSTVAWRLGDSPMSYALEGSVFVAGSLVQWLRDGLGFIKSASEIEPLAASVPDSGGVCLVPAFVGLGAPYWDPFARGMMIGLTRGTTRAHIARAALEAIAFECDDVLQAMVKDTGTPIRELRVDGGASRDDLLMQMQADISGVPVVRPAVTETTALGAAFLAGLSAGLWQSCDEIASLWKAERRFEPAMGSDQRENLIHIWHRAVERACHWSK